MKNNDSLFCLSKSILTVCCLLFLLLGSTNLKAQVTGCSGTFYDSGGASGNYSDNESSSVTYCPNDPSTEAISINFTSFSIEAGSNPLTPCDYDYLEIFNGANISSSSLGVYCDDTGSPGTLISTDASGCLTLFFFSDVATEQAGWSLDVSCVTPTGNSTCSDGIQNGTETGVDCGGVCPSCVSCAEAGVLSITGNVTASGNEYTIALGGTVNFANGGGETLPPAAPGAGSSPTVGYALFACDPATTAGCDVLNTSIYTSPASNSSCPCFLGTDPTIADSDTNSGGASSQLGGLTEYWVVKITIDYFTGCVPSCTDEVDANNDGCFDTGEVYHIIMENDSPTCDCATPDCPAIQYGELSDIGGAPPDGFTNSDCVQYSSDGTPGTGLSNTNVTTCHMVNIPDDFIGVLLSSSDSDPSGCVTVNDISLFAESGGICTGSAITPTTANAGNFGASNNPEWTGLASGTYIICVEREMSNTCEMYTSCLEYYGNSPAPQPTCDCTTPCAAYDRETVTGGTTYQSCVTENIGLFAPQFPNTSTTFTNCYDVQADASGMLGLIQSFTTTPPFCANLIGNSRIVELYPVAANCAGAPVTPTTVNAGNFSETFNPEWTGLTANANYIACITTTVDETCDYGAGCLDYYGIPSNCTISPQNPAAEPPLCQNTTALTLNASDFYSGTPSGTLSFAWSSTPSNILSSSSGSSVNANTNTTGTFTVTLTITEGSDVCGSSSLEIVVQDCSSSCVEQAGTFDVFIDGVNQGSSCGTFNLDSQSEISWTSTGGQVLASGGNSGIVYVIFDQDPSGFDLDEVSTFIGGAPGVLGGDPDNTAPYTTEEGNCAGISSTNASWPSTVYVVPVTADFASPPYNIDTDFDNCVNAGCITTLNYVYTNTFTLGCGDVFTDTGGTTGDYCNNENTSWTICPDNSSEPVEVNFTAFETEGISTCYDGLTIYNGNNASASVLENNVCEASNINPNPVISSAANGCLHFVFTSDSGVTDFGWEATINCPNNCPGPVQFISN